MVPIAHGVVYGLLLSLTATDNGGGKDPGTPHNITSHDVEKVSPTYQM